MFEDSFKLGVKVAAARLGVTPDVIMVKQAAEDIIDTSVEAQQLYSKAGANVLALAGMEGTPEYRILCKCASYNRLLSEETHKAFIDPVKRAFQKSAGWMDSVLQTGSGVSYVALMGSLLTGATAGAGLWGIERALSGDDIETKAKYKQAKKYRQLAKEIKDEMRYTQNQKASAPVNVSHTEDYRF